MDCRLRVGAHSIANSVRGCVARLVERGLELREAAHATGDQLEISEGRREAVEAELEEREVEMDRSDASPAPKYKLRDQS